MREADHQVGLRRREHGLERLHRETARLRRVERGAAADEDDAAHPLAAEAHAARPAAIPAGRERHDGSRQTSPLSIPSRRGCVRTREARQRPARADRAAAPRPVGRLLRDGRGGLALRARREPRHRALRRAHVLQGHRAPSQLARPDDADRRDRRRVQRVHLEGIHGLLRPLRRREARCRARRPARHAPPLEVRAGGDRAREGRDRRGDEHVPGHAARPHRHRLRDADVRRQPARLGDHRHEGHGECGEPRHVHRLRRRVVHGRSHGRRSRRDGRRRAHADARGTARRRAARTATASPHRRSSTGPPARASRFTTRTPSRPI